MLGAFAVMVTAEAAILATVQGPVLWALLLAVLLIMAGMAPVANRYLDRSRPDDDLRADLLGDIAFLESAKVAEPATAEPSLRRQLSVWRPRRRTLPHA